MENMIVTVNKLNRRSAPVNNVSDKSNIIDTVSKGFPFDSITTVTNAAGTWYKDANGNYYWGGGLLNNGDSLATPQFTPQPVTPGRMAPDTACYNFIKSHEGVKLNAYQDSAGIWTIGYGSILYENNQPVRKGDIITQDHAEKLLQLEVNAKSAKVNAALANTTVNQHQYDALVSFAYNAGTGALLGSILLKKVKANPADLFIKDCFMMWDKAHVNGQLVEIEGLKKRREDEAALYFS